MKFSYNWLQSFFKKKLPQPEKLADLLTNHSFETKISAKQDNDCLLEIDVLPNRAHDCLGHLGVAREIAAVLKYPLEQVDFAKKIKTDPKEKTTDFLKVEIKNTKLCPRYTGRVMLDVKIGPSPAWLQQRLKICGLRPINNIVDITNYVMLETGQPLHAFDFDKISSHAGNKKTIIVRSAKKGEQIITLDNEKYDLAENVLVIADEEKPVCLAGIKGGKSPEIDRKTKRIILEAANFNFLVIRQASRQLKLQTDASFRFEHELDANLTSQTIDQAAYLIQELAQGKAAGGRADVYPKKTKPKKIKLTLKQINGLLGLKINSRRVKEILEWLGFGAETDTTDFLVSVPTRRLDISIPEDLIEEIARLYGYQNIPSQLPAAILAPPQRNDELVYLNKIKDILAGLGFAETYNYSFISEKQIQTSRLQSEQLVEIANPLSQEQKYLRPNLILNLLKNIETNQKFFKPGSKKEFLLPGKQVKLFEIGRIFQAMAGQKEPSEKTKLGAILAGQRNKNQPAVFFYQLKGVLDSLFNKLRISDQWYDDEIADPTISGLPDFSQPVRRAEVKVGDDCLGWLAEIRQDFVGDLEAAAFELDFSKLAELASEEGIYLAPSKYPAVVRDIALLVEPGAKVDDVIELIYRAGGPLIQDVDLFDMYEGEEIGEGLKNLAFHIIYQSNERTLTDKEVNQLQEKIIKAAEEGGWEVRR